MPNFIEVVDNEGNIVGQAQGSDGVLGDRPEGYGRVNSGRGIRSSLVRLPAGHS